MEARMSDYGEKVNAMLELCYGIASETHSTGNYKIALLAAGRVAQLAETAAKLTGALGPEPAATSFNAILLSPEWRQLERTLMAALAPYAEARERVATALLTSIPEKVTDE
jgi:hypothetical protein